MRSSASSPMPGPSSSTTISLSERTRRQVTRTFPPGLEKACALDSRLEITCPSRESWPGTENVSVAPLDVVLDHLEQARAAGVVARQRQRFDRRPQRGQRVLQFMSDVGGEHL